MTGPVPAEIKYNEASTKPNEPLINTNYSWTKSKENAEQITQGFYTEWKIQPIVLQ